MPPEKLLFDAAMTLMVCGIIGKEPWKVFELKSNSERDELRSTFGEPLKEL